MYPDQDPWATARDAIRRVASAASTGRKLVPSKRPIGMSHEVHDIRSFKYGAGFKDMAGREYKATNHQRNKQMPPTHFIKLGQAI